MQIILDSNLFAAIHIEQYDGAGKKKLTQDLLAFFEAHPI